MIDLHSHIIFGIDDGSKTIDESLKMLRKAEQNGVSDIVLTPHYIKDSIYNVNNKDKEKKIKELVKKIKEEKININIYLGNEVYIDEDVIELLKNKEICTINDSKYLLIELPFNHKSFILEEVLYRLKKEGIVPIIAHPERYIVYYNDLEFFESLLEKGCLFQGNIGSLYNRYGSKSKKMLIKMLKKNMIHFLGSDIHHGEDTIYEKHIEKDLLKIIKDKEKVFNLLKGNALEVINEEIV